MSNKNNHSSSNIKENIIAGILLLTTTATITSKYLSEARSTKKEAKIPDKHEETLDLDIIEEPVTIETEDEVIVIEDKPVVEEDKDILEEETKITLMNFGYVSSNTTVYDEYSNEKGSLTTYQKVAVYSNALNDTLIMVKYVDDNNELQTGYIDKSTIVGLPSTYIEVDISSQTLYVYVDGEVALTSPIVSGKPATPTNEGYFEIYYKERGATLKGYTKDGRVEYESYVDYWMPFDGGIGLHDAEYHKDENGRRHGWRSLVDFGGETYILHGSHGCVNLPHDTAEYIFKNFLVGTVVLVHR